MRQHLARSCKMGNPAVERVLPAEVLQILGAPGGYHLAASSALQSVLGRCRLAASDARPVRRGSSQLHPLTLGLLVDHHLPRALATGAPVAGLAGCTGCG